MRIIILLILALGLNACTTLSNSEKKLIGTWVLVEETSTWGDDVEPLDITYPDSDDIIDTDSGLALEVELKTILTFNEDKTIVINQMGSTYQANYRLVDAILTLGNRTYIVVKNDKNILIYKDKGGLFEKQYEYRKVK